MNRNICRLIVIGAILLVSLPVPAAEPPGSTSSSKLPGGNTEDRGLGPATASSANRKVDRYDPQPWRKVIRVHAWCRDFLLGSLSGEPPNVYGKAGLDLWVQLPGERGAHRVAPALYPGGEHSSRDASSPPGDGLVSPDARWVALSQKHCVGYAVAYVLQRDEDAGFSPLPKLVSEMGWDRFFEAHPGVLRNHDRMAGITCPGGASLCDLVAWEPDGSRVWFSLRGGNKKAEGIYQWYFAWEPETGTVVVPKEVKLINRFASTRWGGLDGREFSDEWARAEEEHYRFLAKLAGRIEGFEDAPDPEALAREWRQRRSALLAKGNVLGDPVTNPARLARAAIEEQRRGTFIASQRRGAMAGRK